MAEQQLASLLTLNTGEIRAVSVLPTIEHAAGLDQIVESVEVDADYFAQFMARHGLSDGDIARTVYRVSTDSDREDISQRAWHSDPKIVNYGSYDPQSRTVRSNVSGIKKYVDYEADKAAAEGDPFGDGEADDMGSWKATRNALHETFHRIEDAQRQPYETGDATETPHMTRRAVFLGRVVSRALRLSPKYETRQNGAALATSLNGLRDSKAAQSTSFRKYKHSASERRVDELVDAAMLELANAGYYPIRIKFKQQ